MTIADVYAMDGAIANLVDDLKYRRHDWRSARSLLQTYVGWDRIFKPTEETMPLYTAEAYELVLREVYSYIN